MNMATEAIADYDEAISLAPKFALAYFNRGVALVKQGLTRRARDDFEHALKIAVADEDLDLVRQVREALARLE